MKKKKRHALDLTAREARRFLAVVAEAQRACPEHEAPFIVGVCKGALGVMDLDGVDAATVLQHLEARQREAN